MQSTDRNKRQMAQRRVSAKKNKNKKAKKAPLKKQVILKAVRQHVTRAHSRVFVSRSAWSMGHGLWYAQKDLLANLHEPTTVHTHTHTRRRHTPAAARSDRVVFSGRRARRPCLGYGGRCVDICDAAHVCVCVCVFCVCALCVCVYVCVTVPRVVSASREMHPTRRLGIHRPQTLLCARHTGAGRPPARRRGTMALLDLDCNGARTMRMCALCFFVTPGACRVCVPPAHPSCSPKTCTLLFAHTPKLPRDALPPRGGCGHKRVPCDPNKLCVCGAELLPIAAPCTAA
jgi:hypothetical protein